MTLDFVNKASCWAFWNCFESPFPIASMYGYLLIYHKQWTKCRWIYNPPMGLVWVLFATTSGWFNRDWIFWNTRTWMKYPELGWDLVFFFIADYQPLDIQGHPPEKKVCRPQNLYKTPKPEEVWLDVKETGHWLFPRAPHPIIYPLFQDLSILSLFPGSQRPSKK